MLSVPTLVLALALPAAPGSGGEIVQEGSLSGGAGTQVQEVVLEAFDDLGGTRRLESVRVELDTSLIGGGTSSGEGGRPTMVSAVLAVELALDGTTLVSTEAVVSAKVSNTGPPKTFTLFGADSDETTVVGASLSAFQGPGELVLDATSSFTIEEKPDGTVGFSAGGGVDYRVTYAYAEDCPGVLVTPMLARPGACPAPFHPAGRGVLQIALLGTRELDAALVEQGSLLLARADGVGGAVAPNEGPGPVALLADLAAPGAVPCDCGVASADGLADLVLFFRSDELAATLGLDRLPGGTSVPLVLSGALADGTAFSASDCVQIVPIGPPPAGAELTVQANAPGAWVELDVPDRNGDGGGFARFRRVYAPGTPVTLSAAPSWYGAALVGWRELGTGRAWSGPVLVVPAGATGPLEALYVDPASGRPLTPLR